MSKQAEPAVVETTLLYQAAPKIYPKQARGRYAKLRVAAMVLLLGLFYLAPWIEIAGHPLIWFDLPHRRFHLFTLTLVPQDLIFLTWLLLIAALTLFFFTTVGGRLWCGYACPQTVWTEAFLWMERITEGDRYARMKLDKAPWSAEKLLRKGSKHLLWLAFGLLTGLSFVAFFVPARELFPAAASLQLSGWPLFWSLFYGFATWGNAGFMREQVCKYMCPYARFQSAMFDKDTLIIAYDEKRGEPRKSLAKKQGLASGSCVDCSLCVQACPTGIDIRKGLQYECIACAACIDACDAVMEVTQQPKGLIRYTSAHQEAGQPFRLLRPRAVGYGLIWAALCIGFVIAFAQRVPLQFNVLRDRHTLYRELDDGVVENVYVLKVVNEDTVAHRFVLQVSSADGQRYVVEPQELVLGEGEAQSQTVSVRNVKPAEDEQHHASGPRELAFDLRAVDEPKLHRTRKVSFIAGHGHD